MNFRRLAFILAAALAAAAHGQNAQIYQQIYRRIDTSERFDRIAISKSPSTHASARRPMALGEDSIGYVTSNVEGDFVSCDHSPSSGITFDSLIPVSSRFLVITSKGKFIFPGVYVREQSSGDGKTQITYYRPFIVLAGMVDVIPQTDPNASPKYRVYYDFSGRATMNYRTKEQTGSSTQVRIPKAVVDEINYYDKSDKSVVFLKPWGHFQPSGSGSSVTTLPGAGQYEYSASLSATGAPFGNTGKKQAPYAEDRFASDNVASYTFQVAQGAVQGAGEFSPTSTTGSGSYQINSDNFPFQVVGGASNVWTWGGSRDAVGSMQILRSGLVDGIDASFTGEFESISSQAQGFLATSDLTFHIPNQFGSNPKSTVSLYSDWQFPSLVEGIATWDVGLSWKMTDQWTLIGQYNQGGTVTFTISLSR